MEYKTITLEITDKDIKEHGSASGMLIDELAFSAGQWTNEDLYDNNFEYEWSYADYVLKEFNYESAFMETLTKKQAKAYAKDLPKFEQDLREYEEGLKEIADDQDAIAEKCKELADELEEARQSFWEDMTNEWLHGGRERDNNGVIYEIGKYYGAEDTQYDHKTGDSFSFVFDVEDFHDKYCGCGETADNCKEWKRSEWRDLLVDSINIDIESEKRKHEREAQERMKKHKEEKEYREKREKEEKAELVQKLNKIK